MSRRAGIPCGCVLVLLPVAMIWAGAQGVHEAYSFRQPQTISEPEFEKLRPKEGWFHIRGATSSLLDAGWMVEKKEGDSSVSSESSDQKPDQQHDTPSAEEMRGVREVYLPVGTVKQVLGKENKPIFLLVRTADEKTLQTVRHITQLGRKSGGQAIVQFVTKNPERVLVTRDVTGMVQAGINSDERTRKQLANVQANLAPDFVILKEGEKPNMGWSVFLLAGGIGIVLIFLLIGAGIAWRAGKSPGDPPPPPLPRVPPVPPQDFILPQ